MKKRIVSLLVILLALTAATAFAQQTGSQHTDPSHAAAAKQKTSAADWVPPWARNLPAEQQETARKIWEARSRTIHPLVMQIRAKHAQAVAELAQPTVNRQALDQLLKEINSLQAQIARAHVDLMLDVKQQLPEIFLHGMMKGRGMGLGLGMGSGMDMGMGMDDGMGMGMMGGHGSGRGQGGRHGGGQGMMGGGQGMMGGGGCPMMQGSMDHDK